MQLNLSEKPNTFIIQVRRGHKLLDPAYDQKNRMFINDEKPLPVEALAPKSVLLIRNEDEFTVEPLPFALKVELKAVPHIAGPHSLKKSSSSFGSIEYIKDPKTLQIPEVRSASSNQITPQQNEQKIFYQNSYSEFIKSISPLVDISPRTSSPILTRTYNTPLVQKFIDQKQKAIKQNQVGTDLRTVLMGVLAFTPLAVDIIYLAEALRRGDGREVAACEAEAVKQYLWNYGSEVNEGEKVDARTVIRKMMEKMDAGEQATMQSVFRGYL